MPSERQDVSQMTEIVKAIREVEATIDRRAVRTLAAVLMFWGVLTTGIYFFYWNFCMEPGLYDSLFHGFTGLLWVFPVALGYVITALASARVGRLRTSPQESRKIALLVVAFLVPVVVNSLFDLFGVDLNPPGLGVTFVGALFLLFRMERTVWLRRLRLATGALAIPLGFALFLWTPCSSQLVAAGVMAVVLIGFGAAKFLVEG